jgi:hypothetical protein
MPEPTGAYVAVVVARPHDWLRRRDRSGYDCLRCPASHQGEWDSDADARPDECPVEPEAPRPTCTCGREYGVTLLFGHHHECVLWIAYFRDGWRPTDNCDERAS